MNFFKPCNRNSATTKSSLKMSVSVLVLATLIFICCLTLRFSAVFEPVWNDAKVYLPSLSTLGSHNMSRHQDHVTLADMMVPSFNFEVLSNQLIQLLKRPSDVANPNYSNPCVPYNRGSRACKSNCSRPLSDKPEARLWDLLTSSRLTLTDQQLVTVLSLTESMPEDDVIVVSASSANHYHEMQAMFYNLHTVFLPRLNNVSLVLFDIGLTNKQRETTERYCKCRVLNFPFEKFPRHINDRYCYTWKPLIVLAAMDKARKMVIYQDASVRWTNAGLVLVNRTTDIGLQLYRSFKSARISMNTVKRTFDYFGEDPCAYSQFPELHATFSMFKRDALITEAILKPWARCALEDTCMCPALPQSIIACTGYVDYHKCHRFDQSALGIITGKLFKEDLYKFTVPNLEYIAIKRNHLMPHYFNST